MACSRWQHLEARRSGPHCDRRWPVQAAVITLRTAWPRSVLTAPATAWKPGLLASAESAGTLAVPGSVTLEILQPETDEPPNHVLTWSTTRRSAPRSAETRQDRDAHPAKNSVT